MEVQADLCSSRMFSPYREESGGEEELSVLPRHTKVIVTGNNRTKSVLVGLQGVVKKAVGLGGWHWLVLKNGVEVKLQRNALSVLQPPTGNEEDEDEDDSDNSSGNSEILERNNSRFCRRFQFPRVSKPRVQYTRPWTTSLSPKPTSPRSSFKQVQSIVRTSKLRLSFAKLGSRSLGRYCRNFKIGSGNQNLTREQVISVVQQHFVSQKVDEVQVIGEFIRAAKRLKSSSDKFNA